MLYHRLLAETDFQSAQWLMLAGFVMLGWVLARRQLRMRKRVNRDAKAANRALQKIRDSREPAVPLADAPAETQRWQVALFDLQRELKAELDSRIHVVHSLMRQLDDRIERLARLEDQHDHHRPVSTATANTPPPQTSSQPLGQPKVGAPEVGRPEMDAPTGGPSSTVATLARSGHTAGEIAQLTGLAVGDVELLLGTIDVD
jgi:hypothetical protein